MRLNSVACQTTSSKTKKRNQKDDGQSRPRGCAAVDGNTRKRAYGGLGGRTEVLPMLVTSCSSLKGEGSDGKGLCLANFLRMILNPLPTSSEVINICPAVSPPNKR
jgi:hypothetical protein